MEHTFRLILVGVLLNLSLLSFLHAANKTKKTVCSITINSDDEIETFRKFLSPTEFNFTELVTRDRNWLQKACQSGIKCDVVVMSGHFGGSFFGTHGFLSLEDMEAAACDPACDGIFHHATEVYMYGCNTLAGKNKDRRTPQQYIEVLRDDGYSISEAQQIAAFLYSPFGAAFYSRMSKVFSRVPRIYGFDGKAPLGHVIRPVLAGYLKRVAPQFYQAISDPTTAKNSLYASALSSTNSTQIAGDFSESEYPACFINSKERSTTEKLEWIRDQILAELKQNKFDTIPMAQHFFKGLRQKGYQFTRFEDSVVEDLRRNEELKNAIAALKSKLKVMPSVAFQLSDFEHWMEWISDKALYDIEINMFLGDDRRTYASGLRDFVCSLDRTINVQLEQIPPAFLKQDDFLWALACVKPTDERLLVILSEYLKQGQQAGSRIEIANFFSQSRPQNPEVHWNLYRAYQFHTNETLKWFMIHALRSIPATNAEILEHLADALLETRASQLASVLGDAIAKGQPQSPTIHMKVVKAFVKTLTQIDKYNDPWGNKNNLPNSISYVIHSLQPRDPQVREAIISILNSYTLTEVQRQNLKNAIGLR